ncbi:MAG: hypothetical protein AAFV85_00295 [Cyanobacteria bacterium J06634_6]
MAIRLKTKAVSGLLCVAGALAMAAAMAPAASAQEAETVLEAVERIGEQRSGDYYRGRSFSGQIGFLTGLGGFSEQRINRDSAALSGTIEELMILQTQNTPTMRVPDLPNPYTTSVQLLPASQNNSRVIGSELNFEPLPRR